MITASPYSEWGPAWITVPAAGDFTEVPPLAAMSRPEWNSGAFVHGLSRLPNSEFTAPRTGQRDGSAASALRARVMSLSSARRLSPSSITFSARRSSCAMAESLPIGRSVGVARPPMPVPEFLGATTGPSAVSSHHQQAELLLVVHPRGSPLGERTPQILRGF